MKSSRPKLLMLILWAPTVVLATCVKGSVSQGFDWPRWRGAHADGISQETEWDPAALSGGPRLKWQANVGIGYSNIALRGDRIYTAGVKGDSNVVQCLRTDTGQAIWQYSLLSREDPQSTPTVDGNSVYFLNKKGILLCLDAITGKLRWKKDIVSEYGVRKASYGFAGSPVVMKRILLLNANSAGMAVDTNTGRLLWASEAPTDEVHRFGSYDSTGTDYKTPVLYSHRGKQYGLFSSLKGISSVAIETGETLWLQSWGWYSGGMGGDFLLSDGKILNTFDKENSAAPAESILLDIETEKPKILWKSQDFWSEFATPVILNGHIYGCLGGPSTRPASLRCISLESGRMVWEKTFGEIYEQDGVCLMAAGGKLIILTEKGMLSIAEAKPSGYEEISSCDVFSGEKKSRIFWTPPVLCNGRIYCRNYAGELVCIDVRK